MDKLLRWTYVSDGVNVCTGQAEVTDDLETSIVSRQVEGSPAILDKYGKYGLVIQSNVIKKKNTHKESFFGHSETWTQKCKTENVFGLSHKKCKML